MATFTNSNTRVFYATQAATIGAIGNIGSPADGWITGTPPQAGVATLTHGVQCLT